MRRTAILVIALLFAGICADFDHEAQLVGKGSFRVSSNDLQILIANYLQVVATDCRDCP